MIPSVNEEGICLKRAHSIANGTGSAIVKYLRDVLPSEYVVFVHMQDIPLYTVEKVTCFMVMKFK